MSGVANIDDLARRFSGQSLEEILRYALETFREDLRIASSMGVEDMVVVHEAARVGKQIGVRPHIFLLDTGRLHQETYDVIDRVRDRYDVHVDVFAPQTESVQRLLRDKGPNSFYASVENRKECCGIRKVEPLGRALGHARAWVTGLRREQATTRAAVNVFEADQTHRTANGTPLVKVNPLAAWTAQDVWDFVRRNDVPTHALHAKGYPSIGCAPCTRAVAQGEDPRAGRWWWEEAAQKECGLHSPRHLAALAARASK